MRRLGLIAVAELDAVAVAAAVLFAYWFSLPPSVGWWDTGEAQTVPWIAGLFHPTGFPAYVLVGWLWTHAIGGDVAWRLNLLSAVCTAAAAALVVVTARRLGAGRVAAVAAALIFAFSNEVWHNGSRAEPQSLVLLAMALAATCFLSGRLVVGAFFCGIALGAHTAAVWLVLPALVLGLACARPRGALVRRCAVALLAFAIALGTYAYLPIRGAQIVAQRLDPAAAFPGTLHAAWEIDHPETVHGFIRYVTGADVDASGTLPKMANPANYGRFASGFVTDVAQNFGIVAALLAVLGLIAWRTRPLVAVPLVAVAFGPYPFALSFWCADQPAKYYLTGYWIVALAAAAGITALGAAIRKRAPRAAAVPALLALGVAAHQLVASPYWQQRDDRSTAEIVWNTIRNTPDDAVVVAAWSLATPLVYAAYVPQQLGHRVVLADEDHAHLLAIARSHPTYYYPLGDALDFGSAARAERVNGFGPALYRIVLAPADRRRAARGGGYPPPSPTLSGVSVTRPASTSRTRTPG